MDDKKRRPRWTLWLILIVLLWIFRDDIQQLIVDVRRGLTPFEVMLAVALLFIGIRVFLDRDD